MADNDQFRILVGGTSSNSGFAEIATADDGTEPIYVRQYTGVFSSLARTATLLDGSGNTSFPGTVTASTFSGSLSGNASTAYGLNVHTGRNNEANKVVRTDGSGYIQAGWINTDSGDNGTTAIDRVYASSDGYIRYYTPANFRQVLDVPTRTGGSASGNWGINITGSSATTTKVDVPDLRSVSLTPSYFGRSVAAAFMANSTDGLSDGGTYHSILQIQQWSDASGGGSHQLGFTDSNNIYHRGSSGALTSWSSWYKFLDSNNYNSYALPLSGGTLTGNLTMSGAGTGYTIIFGESTKSIGVEGYWMVYKGHNNEGHRFTTTDGSTSTERFTITSSGVTSTGNVTAYSDIKLKENIVTIDSPLNKVKELRGVYYNKKSDELKTRRIGVIAQEIQKILPEVVLTNIEKDEESTLSVDYGNITALLIEAIKEQQATIESLKDRILVLENTKN